jgi:hypothetical protein
MEGTGDVEDGAEDEVISVNSDIAAGFEFLEHAEAEEEEEA